MKHQHKPSSAKPAPAQAPEPDHDRLRIILDHTYQFMGLLDPAGRVLEANRSSMTFIEQGEEAVLGKPFWDTPWWTHSPRMQEELRKAVEKAARGQFVRFNATHRDAQGRLRQIDFSITPYRDRQGKVIFLIPEGRDVTELKSAEEELQAHKDRLEVLIEKRNRDLAELRKEVEERKAAQAALRSSEQQFMDVMYSSPDAVFLISDGRFVDCNQAAVDILGARSKEDVLFLHPAEVSPALQPDGRSSWDLSEGRLAQAVSKGLQRFEWIHRRMDGSEFPAEVTVVGMLLGGRQILYSVLRDLTSRKEAEEELQAYRKHLEELVQARTQQLHARNQELRREVAERGQAEDALRKSERRYRVLFNSISDFIYTHTLDGVMLSLNPKAAERMGYTVDEVVGRPLSDFVPPELKEVAEGEFLSTIAEHGHREGLMTLVDSRGGEHHLEYRSVLVTDDGPEAYISGSGREVTERIKAEKERRQIHEQRVRSQKMEAVGTLASGVAHDFNNVLQGISGYVELLANSDNLNKAQRRYLEEVTLSTQRAARLVRHLLTFSSKAPVDLEALDLNQEVEHVVGLLEHTIPKMVEIEFHPGQGLKPVKGDATQLEQMMLNLGINARDAMPDGGRLIFETSMFRIDEHFVKMHPGSRPGEYLLLKVTDTGHGMSEETQRHMFEPFFTTKPLGKGTGLGLAMVFGIVKTHNGYITGYSNPGQGSTFSIYLPTTDTTARAGDAPSADPYQGLGGSETIMLVDDEEPIREMGRSFLGGLGYRVLTAASGEEALEIYAHESYQVDVVLLDLGMPGMGGAKCLTRIMAVNPLAKVIIASGYTPDFASLKGSASGFIPKPYNLRDLASKVRSVLDQ